MTKQGREKKTWEAYFSSAETMDNWTGGGYFKCLLEINLFGFKLVLWKKHGRN